MSTPENEPEQNGGLQGTLVRIAGMEGCGCLLEAIAIAIIILAIAVAYRGW